MRINELDAITTYSQLDDDDVYAVDTANGTFKVPKKIVSPVPFAVDITTGQWSGSGSDYYISVTASNVTADAILVPVYDKASQALLNGPVWVVPAAGSFTIHTSAIPSGTVKIVVLFPGNMGEAQYQVLADVYSRSQAVAKADIVNDLTSTATDKPLSAEMGKALFELKRYDGSEAGTAKNGATLNTSASYTRCFKRCGIVIAKIRITCPTISTNMVIMTLNSALVPTNDISYVWAHNEWDESINGILTIQGVSGDILANTSCSGKDLTIWVTYPAASL